MFIYLFNNSKTGAIFQSFFKKNTMGIEREVKKRAEDKCEFCGHDELLAISKSKIRYTCLIFYHF